MPPGRPPNNAGKSPSQKDEFRVLKTVTNIFDKAELTEDETARIINYLSLKYLPAVPAE